MRRRWDTIRTAAGVRRLRFKDLRHVFAQAFIQGGGTLTDLQLTLGHSDPTTIMRYLHQQAVENPEVFDKAAKVLLIGPMLWRYSRTENLHNVVHKLVNTNKDAH